MSETYDLIIIGAGVNGCGVAKLAARSGLKVLVLEQYEKAAQGTSGKSSKLIHGGLRYLESGAIHFVYKSLQEREYLLEHYPDLIKVKPFFIPVYEHSKRSGFMVWLGLFLYGALGFFARDSRFHKLAKSEHKTLDGLRQKELKSVFRYYDAQTDDVKLTQAVLKNALAAGAKVEFSKEVKLIKLETDLTKVVTRDGSKYQAKVIVNATGPWVNLLLDKVNPKPDKMPIDLVQGTHLVIKGELEKGLYYVEAKDGRAVFILPWYGNILIGTTEKLHTQNPSQVRASQEEIDYLIATYNYYFPNNVINHDDIMETMAGLRVLPRVKGKIFNRSREVKIVANRRENPRLISIYGGKLTSWHSTASKVLSIIEAAC